MADKNSTWIRQALDQYEGQLLRYAARLLGDDEAARDIVQETFLELCKTKRSKVEDKLAPWLFRVCRNRAFDMRRKEKRVQALSDEQSQNIESPEPNPQEVIESSQGAQALLGMVQKLPDNQKEIVFLRFQSGLSYKEISEITGHSVSYVGVLIHTAVRSIRDTLGSKKAGSKKAGSKKAGSKKTDQALEHAL